ncbi:hypothetical protein [Aeromicrobium fastidiosum]|uniref:Uncharacterized protein n=1 Tax=Aeromicrobium fastidiosum TaxID=52699 RepID=A0A641AL92_9ACTN|nr:hypothetical protein [Aeromicrobium fastidiosum]KAA1376018.1 hypothetical protein ESP62_011205 [Aeromicrobium fastidiosum]MBP2392114.1 hypothetical protein [Aeromicrobium fastidiosum]
MSTAGDMDMAARSVLLPVMLCVLVDGAVAYAVLESPFGTLGFFDDTPPEGSVAVPVLAGLILGVVQAVAFGTRTTVVAAAVNMAVAFVTVMYMIPVGMVVVGCVLGAAVARGARRRLPGQWAVSAAVALALTGAASACYGLTRSDPPDLPLLDVISVPDAPAVVIDPQERSKEGAAVLGDLAQIGGCLGIVDRTAGRHEYVVAWPQGTTASSAPYVLSYEGRSYRLEDFVAVRGGAPITMAIDLEAYAPDLPASCRGRDILLAG